MHAKKGIAITTCLAMMLWCFGCSEQPHKAFDPSGTASLLPPGATQKTGMVLQQYFRLKNALVKEQSDTVAMAARSMKAAVTALLSDSIAWHSPGIAPDSLAYVTSILLRNLDITLSTHDASCEAQRIYFKPISDAAYRLVKLSGLKNVTIYRQYCPMAFNEQGAYWMSLEPGIENPYFGAKMLTCGERTDTLK